MNLLFYINIFWGVIGETWRSRIWQVLGGEPGMFYKLSMAEEIGRVKLFARVVM